MMSEIAKRIADEAQHAEDAEESGVVLRELTKVKVTRGHSRTRTLQVRLNDDELAQLDAIAAGRGLPTSTVARSILLAAIRPAGDISAALAQLERDIATLRGRLATSA